MGTYIGGNIQVEKGLLYDVLDCFRQCKVGCRFLSSGVQSKITVNIIKKNVVCKLTAEPTKIGNDFIR